MSVTVVLDPVRVVVAPKEQVNVSVVPANVAVRVAPTVERVSVVPEILRVTVSPVGTQGAPGTGGGDQEIYIQQNQPTDLTRTWYWIEIDANGDPTGNEYAWVPD